MEDVKLADVIKYLRDWYLPWCPSGNFKAVLFTILELEKIKRKEDLIKL